jgi:hypothetical protein
VPHSDERPPGRTGDDRGREHPDPTRAGRHDDDGPIEREWIGSRGDGEATESGWEGPGGEDALPMPEYGEGGTTVLDASEE